MVPAITLSTVGFLSPAGADKGWGFAEPVVGSQEWDVGRGDVFCAPPIPVLAVPSRQLVNKGIEGWLDWELLCLARKVPKSFETWCKL